MGRVLDGSELPSLRGFALYSHTPQLQGTTYTDQRFSIAPFRFFQRYALHEHIFFLLCTAYTIRH